MGTPLITLLSRKFNGKIKSANADHVTSEIKNEM